MHRKRPALWNTSTYSTYKACSTRQAGYTGFSGRTTDGDAARTGPGSQEGIGNARWRRGAVTGGTLSRWSARKPFRQLIRRVLRLEDGARSTHRCMKLRLLSRTCRRSSSKQAPLIAARRRGQSEGRVRAADDPFGQRYISKPRWEVEVKTRDGATHCAAGLRQGRGPRSSRSRRARDERLLTW